MNVDEALYILAPLEQKNTRFNEIKIIIRTNK